MADKFCKSCGDEFSGDRQMCPICTVEKLRSDSDLNAVSKPGLYRVDDKQGMTASKALEFWKFRYDRTKNYVDEHWETSELKEHNEYVAALKTAIEALEKQIPYKPKEYEDKFYSCKCGNILLMKWKKYPTELTPKSEGLPFCLGCGQAIDWSE